MAGKTYIKTGASSWSKVKKIYLKEGATTWRAIRKAYIKTGATTWKKVFDTASNRPYLANGDRPRIRLNSYRSTGYIEAEPVQQMGPPYTNPTTGWSSGTVGDYLWGADAGDLNNWVSGGGSAMTSSYQWLYSTSTDPNTQIPITWDTVPTGEPKDKFKNSSTYLGQYDGNYIWFKPTYTNASGSTSAVSNRVLIVKQVPTVTWFYFSAPATGATIGTQMTATWRVEDYWYNSVLLTGSKVEWYLEANNTSPLLDSTTRIQTDYLSTGYSQGSNYVEGTSSFTPTVANGASGKYIYARLILKNSYTDYVYGSNAYAGATISRGPALAAPTVDVYPTITKVDGYLTIPASGLYTGDTTDGTSYTQCRIRGNTGKYTPDPTEISWQFQYSADGSTGWSQFYDSGGAIQSSITNDTLENQTHDYYLEDKFYTDSNGLIPNNSYNQVSVVGKYLRFGANAYNVTSPTGYNYASLGPIYNAPTSPGIPNITVGAQYSSSQRYINVWWNPSSIKFTYYFQYYNGLNWVTLSSTTSDTFNGSFYTPITVLAPIGTYSYRVINKNPEGVFAKSSSVSYTLSNPYSFVMGNTIYVSTNGRVDLDSGSTNIAVPSTGKSIAVFDMDLQQTALNVWSDSTRYVVWYTGYQLGYVNNANYKLEYQMMFDTSKSYVDIYITNKGSSLVGGVTGFYTNGTSSGVNGPYALFAGQTLRLYFDGTTSGSTAVATSLPINTAYFVNPGSTFNNTYDDSYTQITTQPNVTIPYISSNPTFTLQSGTANSVNSTYRLTSGSWVGAPTQFRYRIEKNDAGGTVLAQYPSSTTFTTATYYDYTFTASSSSSVAGVVIAKNSYGESYYAYSNSVGPITYPSPSQTIAPYAKATNTNSTTIVKYGDSITWSGGTYSNAASVTSVLIYSTSTSNLVSPNGDTNSLTRTSNPYVITTSDPTGSPYIFTVRDTVVGNNGTTYYYYSNQITSALADGIAFSYGTATSATGGWSASINSGTQTGATYSYVSTTAGSATVNSSTGAVTATGLSSGGSSTVTVSKSVSGYSTVNATVSGSALTISAPSGGSVSISTNTGNYNVGSVITYSTSGWSGSPTSYYLELHNGTNPVLTSDPLRASTTSTSGTYTITSSDVPNYFKAWATATNAGGSTQTSSVQVGPATNNVAPSISASSISPSSGTAGSTTFTASATVSGSPTPTVSYEWQYLSTSFSYVTVATGQTYTPPSNFNTLYPNYGFYCLITATNAAGSATARPSATLNNPATVVKPGTPTNPINSYSGSSGGNYNYSASWTAPTTGTTPFDYYIQVWGAASATSGTTGSGGSYVGTFGPFSATSCTYSSTYAWNYFQVWAQNSAGASANSVSSTWQ